MACPVSISPARGETTAAAEKLGYQIDWRPVQVWDIPTPMGDQGVAVTIVIMRMAAQAGAHDPQIRELALHIVRGVGNGDSQGEIAAIYHWVQRNIAFRGENDETVQAPEVTLRFEGADCDCQSVLMAALLGSIGYTVDFRTVAPVGEHDFTHVYVAVMDDSSGEWQALPLDTTVHSYPGWEPSPVSRQVEWAGVDQSPPSSAMLELGELITGRKPFMGYLRQRRYLGDGDPTTADQVSEVITAFTPIATTAIRQAGGGPGYSPPTPQTYGVQGYVTPTSAHASASTPSWLWPAVGLTAGVYVLSKVFAQNRSGR